MSEAPDALNTWIAPHVRLSQNGERWRKGIRFFSWLGEGICASKSGNSQLILRLFIKGFEIVIADWPIFDGSSRNTSIGRLHTKVFLLESPFGRAVSDRASSNRRCCLSVAIAHTGIDALGSFTIGISKCPRVRKHRRPISRRKRVLAV